MSTINVCAAAVALIAATNLSAQDWRDTLKKARDKAQQAATAPGQTKSPAERNPAATPARNQTWYAYCQAGVKKASEAGPYRTYFSDVFAYDHSDAEIRVFMLNAWQTHVKENYGTVGSHRSSCSWNSGPAETGGEQRLRKEKETRLNSMSHRSQVGAPPDIPTVETGWTYKGERVSTCVDDSVATGCPEPVSSKSAPATTPSPAAVDPDARPVFDREDDRRKAALRGTAQRHWYCSSDTTLPTLYLTAPFASTDSPAATTAFKKYLKEEFKYDGFAHPVCLGSFASLDAARQNEQQLASRMRASKKQVIETDWTP